MIMDNSILNFNQGELHLEVIVDRLVTEFRVPIKTGAPCINYKEAMRCDDGASCFALS